MANDNKTALLCAYTLASAGRYSDAEALLLSGNEAARSVEAMDLLARIRVEQGDIPEARRLWQSIQSFRPEHAPSREALKALDRPSRILPFRHALVWALPLALALGVLAGMWFARPKAPVAVVWPGIPTGAHLEALSVHRGKVQRVLLSSDFFADARRVSHRELLAQYLADALGVAPGEVFISSAQAGQAEGTIRVELIRR